MIATNFKQMRKKFFSSLSLNILLKIKSVIILIFIYPFFDKTQIGVYAIGLTISGLLSPILLFNLMDGSNKFFLKNINYAEKLKVAIKQFVSLIIIIISVIIYYLYFYSDINPEIIKVLFYLIIYRLLLKSLIYQFEIFQNLLKTFIINIIVEFGSLIFIYLYLSNTNNPNIEIIPFSLFCIVIIIAILRWQTVFNFNFSNLFKTWQKFKKPIKVSLSLLPVPYLLILIKSTDVLLLNFLIGFDANGIYHIANSIALLVAILSSALSYFWYSSVTLSNSKLINNILNKSIYLYLLLLPLLFVSFYYTAKFILTFFFSYDAHLVSAFLAMGYFTLFFTQLFHGYFYSTSQYDVIVKVSMITFFMNIIFSYILIKQYGINGAGFGTFLSYVAGYCYCIFVFKSIKKKSL